MLVAPGATAAAVLFSASAWGGVAHATTHFLPPRSHGHVFPCATYAPRTVKCIPASQHVQPQGCLRVAGGDINTIVYKKGVGLSCLLSPVLPAYETQLRITRECVPKTEPCSMPYNESCSFPCTEAVSAARPGTLGLLLCLLSCWERAPTRCSWL